MKKILVLLLAAALILSLAACGNSKTESKTDSSVTEVTQSVKEIESVIETETEVETVTEASAIEEADDVALIEAAKEQLIGSWTYVGFDEEHLTFNADGTGTYKGIMDKDCSFTYVVSIRHAEYNNGAEYMNNLLSITYDTGEAEEITFEFREDEGGKMIFHNSDYTSGYSGVMNFDEWTKA